MHRRDPEELRLKNIENRLNYLYGKVSEIEIELGFNHSGTDSIKNRIEMLEYYSFVDEHHEFESILSDKTVGSTNNLFAAYLVKKLTTMNSIISLPPIVTKCRHGPNEIYNFDKFPPYDRVEKLFHQCQLLLLFLSPEITFDLQENILMLIFKLRDCYWVTSGILDWILEPKKESLDYVKANFEKTIKKLRNVH